MKYLLDSNVIIEYLGAKFEPVTFEALHSIVNDGLFISIITKIEVLGFSSGVKALDVNTERFIDLSIVFDLTTEIANQTIQIRKYNKIKIADAIIASTAMVHGMTLLSRNLNDFKNINGLTVIDPHTLK